MNIHSFCFCRRNQMLIDDFLPKYDFVETHDIEICASAETVFGVMNEVDLCESPIIRALFFLRGLPNAKLRLRDLQKSRFEILGVEKDKELLLGLAGKFWTLRGEMQEVNADNFREFDKKVFPKPSGIFRLTAAGTKPV